MHDSFGRLIEYVRISVTDRCDFRCHYCMAERMKFLPKSEILSLEEIQLACQAFIELGVTKIRITGGEPLVRANVMQLFEGLSPNLKTGALKELALTTNASQLERYAGQLADLGVKRVNVSLDSLRGDVFHQITRRGRLEQVLGGIKVAKKVGLAIKINMVVLKGINDDEIHEMISWCGDEGFDLTFIEVMPMGELDAQERRRRYMPLERVRTMIAKRWDVDPIPLKTNGPADYIRIAQTGGRVGFIAPMTHNFCAHCNRVRFTATGVLYLCLGQNDKVDLKPFLRLGDKEKVKAEILKAVARKPWGHNFKIACQQEEENGMTRYMNTTGG